MSHGFVISRSHAPVSGRQAIAMLGDDTPCPLQWPLYGGMPAPVTNPGAYFTTLYRGVSNRTEAPEIVALRAKLNELRLLCDNWDGRGAVSPSPWAIAYAERILDAASAEGFAPHRVAADVEGGIAVYYFGGERATGGGHSRQVGMMIDNEGDGAVYFRERGGRMRCLGLAAATAHLGGLFAEVSLFLRG